MPSSSDEVAVFVDTNIDTHMALAVSPDISIAEFKRELESMHSRCFAKVGDVKVHDLMVKRSSCFYHLPESLPIKCAFQGLKGTWFLYVVVRALSGLDEHFPSKCLTAKVDNPVSDVQDATDSPITDAPRSKMSCSNQEMIRKTELSNTETPGDTDSEDVTNLEEQRTRTKKVSNILACGVYDHNKECTKIEETPGIGSGGNSEFQFDRNENEPMIPSSCILETFNVRSATKNDNFPDMRVYATHHVAANGSFTCQLPTDSRLEGFGTKPDRTAIHKPKRTSAVGKRVLIAASNIRNSGNKHRPAVSLNRIGGCTSALYVTRSPVFEISDSDD